MAAPRKVNLFLKARIIERHGNMINLCRKYGWSEDQVSKIIHGRRQPSEQERHLLAQDLGVSEQELFPS